MYLYEKSNGNIDVYEIKENIEKIKNYKKQEMSKLSKDDIVFKLLFNNRVYLNGFDCFDVIKSNFITDNAKKIKDKFLLEKMFYNNTENKIIIDGLLHNYFEGNFDNEQIKSVKNGNIIERRFLIPNSETKLTKAYDLFSPEIYEIPYCLTLTESLVLLKDLRDGLLFKVYNKNIDEQLALFDFNNEPVGSYDIRIINNLIKHRLCSRSKYDDDLEISQSVLKKVRMINK